MCSTQSGDSTELTLCGGLKAAAQGGFPFPATMFVHAKIIVMEVVKNWEFTSRKSGFFSISKRNSLETSSNYKILNVSSI